MRPLDGIEKFFYSVSSLSTSTGITHMMVTVSAQLPLLPVVIDHVIENASLAWKSLRFNHPRIACTVEDGSFGIKFQAKRASRLGSPRLSSSIPLDGPDKNY
jgi:hypothetical protein